MATRRGVRQVARRAFVRAQVRGRRRLRTPAGRVATVIVLVLAGLMMSSAAMAARGRDLRPDRNTDLVAVVAEQTARNRELAAEVTSLRAEVNTLTAQQPGAAVDTDELALATALTAVVGPAVSVSLSDAPLSVKPAGVDEDLLVVHQQDIQAVVNVLWGAGAEAMTIQGQRVTSRTGIKCVGNSVVLQGVPYAPPYVIVAIGDQRRLEAALESSRYLTIYRQYVEAYGLGYAEKRVTDARLAAYTGPVELRYASAMPSASPVPSPSQVPSPTR